MKQEQRITKLKQILALAGVQIDMWPPDTAVEEGFVTGLIEAATGWVADKERKKGRPNQAAVDIFFPARGTVVQVTSEKGKRKVVHTIEMCEKHVDKREFNRIIMFYSGKEKWRGRGTEVVVNGIEHWKVRIPEDIWGYTRILERLASEPERTEETLKVARAFIGALQESERGETITINRMQMPNEWIARTNSQNIRRQLGTKVLAWIQGPIGSGKTVAARQLVKEYGVSEARLYELKNVGGKEWEKALKEAEGAKEELIWIEDLVIGTRMENQKAVSRVVDYCEREEKKLVVTSYEGPPSGGNVRVQERAAIWQLGPFTLGEVEERAKKEGFSKREAPLAMAASGGGNAMLIDRYFQDRGKVPGITALLEGAEAQRAKKEKENEVIDTLSHELCAVLAKLGMQTEGFTREEIRRVTGADVTGENLREWGKVEGRWVEKGMGGKFKVSPLLSRLAERALDEESKRRAHNEWLEVKIEDIGRKDVDVDNMLYNAVMGKNEGFIVRVCYWVTTANAADTDKWRRASTWLRGTMDDIVEPWISRDAMVMLKMALLRVTDGTQKERRRKVWKDMTELTGSIRSSAETRYQVETLLALCNLLRMDEWQNTLENIPEWAVKGRQAQIKTGGILNEETNTESGKGKPNIGQIMVAYTLAGLRRIEHLQTLLKQLGELTPEDRKGVTEKIEGVTGSDESEDPLEIAINAPWLDAQKMGKEKAVALIPEYWDMDKMVADWQDKKTRVYIRICISVLENEYQEDRSRARQALEIDNVPDDLRSRMLVARAKIEESENNWRPALALREQARLCEPKETNLQKMITRRADAICAWESGEFRKARKLFLEASNHGTQSAWGMNVATGGWETETEAEAYAERMRIRSLALKLDSALAEAQAGGIEKAIEEMFEIARKLREKEATDNDDGNRLTRVLTHAALWVCEIGRGWTKAELQKPFGVVAGVASEEGWPEESKEWRIPRTDHYLAAAYNCALAQLELTQSETLADRLEEDPHEIEGIEILVSLKRRDLAMLRGDWTCAIAYAERAEQIANKKGLGLSLKSREKKESRGGENRTLTTGHASALLIAITLREALLYRYTSRGDETSELTVTRRAYEALKQYTGKVDWAEALLQVPNNPGEIYSDSGRAMFRTTTSLYRHHRTGAEHGTKYERWRWALQTWLFSEANPAREIIDSALHTWFEKEGMWKMTPGTSDMRRQAFAQRLYELMRRNRMWQRDVHSAVQKQLETATKRSAVLPQPGNTGTVQLQESVK